MHSLKKTIAFFLVLALVVQVLPTSIFAVDANSNRCLNQEKNTAESKDQAAKVDESKQQAPTVVGEVANLRGETEKHFRLNDGSFIAVDYGMPVHFTEDGGSSWQDIDNTLVLSQNDAASKQQAMWQNVGEPSYTAKNGKNSHSFASDFRSGTLFTAQTDSYGLRMALTDSNMQGETFASEDEAMNAKIAEQVKDGIPATGQTCYTTTRPISVSLASSRKSITPVTPRQSISLLRSTARWTAGSIPPE